MARKTSQEIEDHCPLPDTHRRLAAAHRLWHQTLKVYSNPDAFRTNLNATIQELRNVTFILQKEHRKVPDFAAWYGPHQATMKADVLLRWLVDARNKVVKEGDLATNSKALVSIVDGYVDSVPFVTEVPATASAKQIALAFAARAPSQFRDAYLVVERRWEVDDLPGRELLDALATCYASLELLVADAHRVAGGAYVPAACPSTKGGPFAQKVLCMNVGRELRSVRIDLGARSFSTMRRRRIGNSPAVSKAAQERYGPHGDAKTFASGDYSTIARELHRMARVIIQKDPELLTAVQLYKGAKVVHVGMLMPQDQAAKYALWREVAEAVEAFDADTVIANVEAWLTPLGAPGPRQECVITFCESSNGQGLKLTSVFRREGTTVVLEDPVEEASTAGMNVLEPIRGVWRRRAGA